MGSIFTGWACTAVGIFGAAIGWILSYKILANFMGPDGVGLFGQFRQIVQTASMIATYGGTNVLVQSLSSQNNDDVRNKLRVSLFKLFILTSFCVALIMFIFAGELTQLTLSSSYPHMVLFMRWLILAVLLSSLSIYCVALLNVYSSHLFMTLTQSTGPVFLSLFIWIYCSYVQIGIDSLVVALIFCFGLSCLFGVWGLLRLNLPKVTIDEHNTISRQLFEELRSFATFNLFAVISSLFALLIVRAWNIQSQGLEFAGLFEAGWSLTFNYLTLFLTVCNTFYLPLLARAFGAKQLKNHILKTAYGVLGGSVLFCYSIMLWQEELIHLLYSPSFDDASEVTSILIIAIIFRGVSWVFGTLLVATRKAKILFASDLSMNVGILVAVGYVLNNQPTLKALGWAFVAPHFLYLLFVIEYVCHSNSLMRRREIWPIVIIAVAPVIYLATTSETHFFLNTSQKRMVIGGVGLLTCGFIYLQFRRVAACVN